MSENGDVYEDGLFKLSGSDGNFTPILVLFAVRLGVGGIHPIYWDFLKLCLQTKQSVGIAGGRPSSSHYFVAFQNDMFIFLDPHETQQAAKLESTEACSNEAAATFHTRSLHWIHLQNMDPSMVIGFLIRTQDDYIDWKNSVQSLPEKSRFLHILEKEPRVSEYENDVMALSDDLEEG